MTPSHYNENMSERTSPADAIERLSWILNYVGGDTQSLNSLAEQSDLSWATVRKYTATIETVQKVAPKIAADANGVEVGSRSRAMSDLIEDPVAALTVYLFTQAEMQGGANEPIDKALCEGVSEELEDALEHAIELGWVSEVDEGRIKLTPTGIRVAGPARSEVESFDHHKAESDLHIHHEGSEAVITLADESAGSPERKSLSKERYNTDSYQDDAEQAPTDKSRYPAAA
jgi:hypothetical protein